ncbi:NRAMP family divalent metal transporter [Pseudidiomarina mangrovi]|uniref:NRAMP family divalent metal transporter n=1 Tax=Pseudidiomarina mangrovi TaxID=2487133 RepID=UPI000FCCD85A|nr:divalent metal cation transporter [Pseudidiomarina mangrovi]
MHLPPSTRRSALGPGIILAAAAVGASHLVASTQAGALFGWQLWWLIVLVNVLKYPFFRFAVTYTLEHNENLMVGYLRKGRWYLQLFTGLNILAAVVNTAGVLLLTGALLQFFVPQFSITLICSLLLVLCLLILMAGQYRSLDIISKWIMALLSVATVIAVVIAWQNAAPVDPNRDMPSPWQLSAVAFLVAMMGWMPVPIELSAINSLWLQSKQKITQLAPRHALFDFHLGYWVTAILALMFLALGAMVQFGTEQPIQMAGAQFTTQFVNMYGSTIGEWSEYLVGFIAFLCMFGTTLAVLDGYSRTLRESFRLLRTRTHTAEGKPRLNSSLRGWLIAQSIAGLVVILFFRGALGPMLTFAMTAAFLTTPFFAWLNFSLVRHTLPQRWLRVYAWLGLFYLTAFALLYLVWLVWA